MATLSHHSWRIAAFSAITSATITVGLMVVLLPHIKGNTSAYAVASSSTSSNSSFGMYPTNEDPNDSPIVQTVRVSEPAVVSITITKDVPVIQRNFRSDSFGEQFFDDPFYFSFPRYSTDGRTEKREVGGGTAFFVSTDGLLLTNKHVVEDEKADYTVFLNDGRKLKATVVARDPISDIALLKVDGGPFTALSLSKSSEPVLGQTVVAIGNALGEFRNTVSVGVISGLRRSIVAGGLLSGETEQLSSIIQTDAAINQGNSGGPLVNLHGEVIGMNTAVAGGAQNIAFAIPAVSLQRALDSYKKYGRIVQPYIGIRYMPITQEIQEEKKLQYSYGMLIVKGDGDSEPAILPGSPADKADLKEGDIIVSIDGQKLTTEMPLGSIIERRHVGDVVHLHIVRGNQEKDVTITLEERKE